MKSKFTNLPASEQDKSKTVKFYDDEKSGVTVCSLFDRWNYRTFVARTRVHDVDQYDKQTGRAIAFNKARRKELLNDLSVIAQERTHLKRWYENEMNKLDKQEGIKHIYLAGVDEELNSLLGVTPLDGADGEPVNFTDNESTDEHAVAQINIKDIKLTQYANFTETEL